MSKIGAGLTALFLSVTICLISAVWFWRQTTGGKKVKEQKRCPKCGGRCFCEACGECINCKDGNAGKSDYCQHCDRLVADRYVGT